MPTDEEIVDLLLGHPKGVVVTCNLQQCLKENLVDRKLVQKFLKWWFDFYRSPYVGAPGDIDALLNAMEQVVFDNKPVDFNPATAKPEFRLQCQGADCSLSTQDASHVMTFSTFVGYVAHADDYPGQMDGFHIPGWKEPSSPDTKRAVTYFSSKGNWNCRIREQGTLGNPWGLLWYTKQAKEPGLATADKIRDERGLIDRNEGDILVEVILTAQCLVTQNPRRPTFMDGCTGRRFRVRADGKSKHSRKSWGHAVDLRKLAAGQSNIDGVCERVCQPIPATAVASIDCRIVGELSSCRGEQPTDNDDAFANHLLSNCPTKEDIKELKTFMMDLL